MFRLHILMFASIFETNDEVLYQIAQWSAVNNFTGMVCEAFREDTQNLKVV